MSPTTNLVVQLREWVFSRNPVLWHNIRFWWFWVKLNLLITKPSSGSPGANFIDEIIDEINEIQNGCHITFENDTFGHIFVHNWHRNFILMFWRSSNPYKYISLYLRHEIVFYFTLTRFLFTKFFELLVFSLSFRTENRTYI